MSYFIYYIDDNLESSILKCHLSSPGNTGGKGIPWRQKSWYTFSYGTAYGH